MSFGLDVHGGEVVQSPSQRRNERLRSVESGASREYGIIDGQPRMWTFLDELASGPPKRPRFGVPR